jgi:hypothetical protein
VPLPPTFILPNRQNGVENVATVLGTTSRITITLAGSEGISLEVILQDGAELEEGWLWWKEDLGKSEDFERYGWTTSSF